MAPRSSRKVWKCSCIQSGLMCRLKLINLFLAIHRPPVDTLTDVEFGVEQTAAQIKSGLSKALTSALVLRTFHSRF